MINVQFSYVAVRRQELEIIKEENKPWYERVPVLFQKYRVLIKFEDIAVLFITSE